MLRSVTGLSGPLLSPLGLRGKGWTEEKPCAEGVGEREVAREERFAAAETEKGSPRPRPAYCRPAPNPVEVEPSVFQLPFKKLPLTAPLEEEDERKDRKSGV